MVVAGDMDAVAAALQFRRQDTRTRHATRKAAEHADRPRYAVCKVWDHYFSDNLPEFDTRWVFDRHRWGVAVLHVKRRSDTIWSVGLPEEVADLEESLVEANTDAHDLAMDEWGVQETDALPAWVDEAVVIERRPFVDALPAGQAGLDASLPALSNSCIGMGIEEKRILPDHMPISLGSVEAPDDSLRFLGCADWKHKFPDAVKDTPIRWVLDRRTMHIEVLHVRDVDNNIWLDGTEAEIRDLEHKLLPWHAGMIGNAARPDFTTGDRFPGWVHECVFVRNSRILKDRTW